MLLGFMAFGSIIMQLFLLVNVLTVSRACLVARDPIPVEPDTRLRVAFLTTIVPDKEPVEVAERTLRAAKAIVYDGKLDLWLLDEGNTNEVRAMAGGSACMTSAARTGGTWSSKGGPSPPGPSTVTTTTGCRVPGHDNVVMFVVTDHVPFRCSPSAARLLPRPDVAFVVAPVLRQPGQPHHPLGSIASTCSTA